MVNYSYFGRKLDKDDLLNDGNKDAVVAAFRLSPTQLRIADLITRRPDNDEDTHTPREPEIARIYDDAIIIEPYLTKK